MTKKEELTKIVLDYGNTTTIIIAEFKSGTETKTKYIQHDEGTLSISSTIFICDEENENKEVMEKIIFGQTTMSQYKFCIRSLKTKFFLNKPDLKIIKQLEGKHTASLKHQYNAEDLLKKQMKYFKSLIESNYVITKETLIVCSMPNNTFNGQQKKRYKELIELVFNSKKIELLRESDCAIFTQKIEKEEILVLLDIGGGTSDVTVMLNNTILHNGSVKIQQQNGSGLDFGGDEYTKLMYKIYDGFGLPKDDRHMFWEKHHDLLLALESLKIKISNALENNQKQEIPVGTSRIVLTRYADLINSNNDVENLKEKLLGMSANSWDFTKKDYLFEKLDDLYVSYINGLLENQLKDHKENIIIVLTGGGSRLHTLRKKINDFCETKNIKFDKKVNSTTIVAEGLLLADTIGKSIKCLENPIGILLEIGGKPAIQEIFKKHDKLDVCKDFYLTCNVIPGTVMVMKFAEVLLSDDDYVNDYGKTEFEFGGSATLNFFIKISVMIKSSDYTIVVNFENVSKHKRFVINPTEKKRISKKEFMDVNSTSLFNKETYNNRNIDFKCDCSELRNFIEENEEKFDNMFKKKKVPVNDRKIFAKKRKLSDTDIDPTPDVIKKKVKIGNFTFDFDNDYVVINNKKSIEKNKKTKEASIKTQTKKDDDHINKSSTLETVIKTPTLKTPTLKTPVLNSVENGFILGSVDNGITFGSINNGITFGSVDNKITLNLRELNDDVHEFGGLLNDALIFGDEHFDYDNIKTPRYIGN